MTQSFEEDRPERKSADLPAEAIEHLGPLIVPASMTPSILDDEGLSRYLIAQAIQKRLAEIEMSIFELHERSGVALATIDQIINQTHDLGDFEPVIKIESVIRASLRHL